MKTQTKAIPEELQPFYNWLCENFDIKSANLWLDKQYDAFIEYIQETE